MNKPYKPYAAKLAGIAADYIDELSLIDSNDQIELSDYLTREELSDYLIRDEAVTLSEAIDVLREFEQDYTIDYRGY